MRKISHDKVRDISIQFLTLFLVSRLSNPKLCNYTNYYFCQTCMHDTPMQIPSKILQSWNWSPHQVSFIAFRYLQENFRNSEPIDISKAPDLQQILPNLLQTQKIKTKLLQIVNFTDSCRLADTRNAYIAKTPNFLNVYTLEELKNLPKLEKSMKKLFDDLESHVEKCPICRGRGFICEYCRDERSIYEFDENVVKCGECGTLSHDFCFMDREDRGLGCLKCERIVKNRRVGKIF